MKNDIQFYAVWNIESGRIVPGMGRMCFKSASRVADTLEKKTGDGHTLRFAA